MLTRKKKLLLSLTAATPLLFAGCVDNSLGPYADAAGTYQLTIYAGQTLVAHYTFQPNDPNYPDFPSGGSLDVVDGTMVLSTNGTFTETNNYVITPNGGGAAQNRNFVSQGTWTVSGTNWTLSAPAQGLNGARYVTGTLSLDRINYQEANQAGIFEAYEYRR
jgi:hypothetical protein